MTDSRGGVTPGHCLSCGAFIDAATMLGGEKRPRPGDISVCLKCGGLAVFTPEGALRPLTAAEILDVAEDQRVQAVRSLALRKPWEAR